MSRNIRNFCIIAHVDHGKSTLADRLLVITGTVSREKIGEQFLDSNPIAREHGITIKLAPVRMELKWTMENGQVKIADTKNSSVNSQLSILNLIDTPGHVDFSYEVVRTLYACEGAVLLVDATKGIQAQTVAHYSFAKKLGLTIIPVINKIDLPSIDMNRVENEIVESFGFDKNDILKISAKTGLGVIELIDAIIKRVPEPIGSYSDPLQALIFDSLYDEHKGVVIFVRVKNGGIKKNDEIVFLSDGTVAHVLDVGYMQPSYVFTDEITTGEVGFVITNIKDISLAKVGDTITHFDKRSTALEGYQPVKPFVFLSIFPNTQAEYNNLRKAVLKLKLTDSSLVFTPEYSNLLGPGLRFGFLGLLHAQITIERIEKEFGVDVFVAPPSIEYILDGKKISNPRDFDMGAKEVLEPYIKGEIYAPVMYLGPLVELIYKRRGEKQDVIYFGLQQVKIVFVMPLASVVYDFYDTIKSVSSGFASFDYEFSEYRQSNLVKVDIVLNGNIISEFSFIVHEAESYTFARGIIEKLKNLIPKHSFEITIQAKVGGKIIASEKIGALHKNVIEKLSGGDYTRKSKLLDKQKKGKERMKTIGEVRIPKETFMEVLKS